MEFLEANQLHRKYGGAQRSGGTCGFFPRYSHCLQPPGLLLSCPVLSFSAAALSLCSRRGGAYCVQLLDRRVIQLQPGGLDQVGQVPVTGGAGDGSSYAGLHH
jgi:hypothetical protein